MKRVRREGKMKKDAEMKPCNQKKKQRDRVELQLVVSNATATR